MSRLRAWQQLREPLALEESGGGPYPASVSIIGPAGPVSANFTVNVVFSKPVSGLLNTMFDVVNGTAGALAGAGTTYTLDVENVGPGSPCTVFLPQGSVVDDVDGLLNNASNVYSVAVELAVMFKQAYEAEPGSWTIDSATGEDRVTRLDDTVAAGFVTQPNVSLAPRAFDDRALLFDPGEFLDIEALAHPIDLSDCTLYGLVAVDDQVIDKIVPLYALHRGDPLTWMDHFGVFWDGYTQEVGCIYGDGTPGSGVVIRGTAPVVITPSSPPVWTFKVGEGGTRKFYVGGTGNQIGTDATHKPLVCTHFTAGLPGVT